MPQTRTVINERYIKMPQQQTVIDAKSENHHGTQLAVIDAPSIVNGTVYWGSGYRNISPGIGNNKLYAFTLPKGGN
jgi:hypothetical protein